jgi:hypothetical protein
MPRRPLSSRISRKSSKQIFNSLENLEPRQLLAAHIVGSTTSYSTIQAAVNAASAGAVINVDAGTYTETVTISKSLTIKGAQAGVDARTRSTKSESIVTGATVTGKGVGNSFIINANDVTLDGFTVQGETNQNTVISAGILMEPGTYGVHILDNIVQNNVSGLFLSNASATDPAVIQHNLFQNNNNAGANGGRGIYTDGGVSGGNITDVEIDSNNFINNRGGSGTTGLEAAVAFEAQTAGKQSNITVTNNTFTNNGKSTLFFNTVGVTEEGNTASGAADWYSGSFRFEGNDHNVTIKYNNIINNPGPGVAVDSSGATGDSSGFDVEFNNITNNGTNTTYGKTRLGITFNENEYDGAFIATNNYWGSASGPSGDGPGTGDGIYSDAYKTDHWHFVKSAGPETFAPWATSSVAISIPTIPGTPSGLSATASGTQISLKWTNGTGGTASGINILRSTDGLNFTTVTTVGGTATSYIDTNLSAGTTYYYEVQETNVAGTSAPSNTVHATTSGGSASTFLSDLNWTSATSGYSTVQKDESIGGNILKIGTTSYGKGIGTHAVSVITYNLAGAYTGFQSDVGIDAEEDGKGTGHVEFIVLGDGNKLFDSGVMTNDQVQHVNVSIAGVNTLTLEALNGVANSIDFDHSDWGNAQVLGATSTPAAPANFVATATSSTQIKLSWTAGPANLISYAIDRSTNGTMWTSLISNLDGTATSYTDPATLTAGTKYYYRITATNSAGAGTSATTSTTTLPSAATTTYLSDMTWVSATTGYGTIGLDKTISGNTITLNGVTYAKGLGTHAASQIIYNIAGQYNQFVSDVGIDDEEDKAGTGSVEFQVIGDGKVLFDSGVMTNTSATQHIAVDVTGVQQLTLLATNGVPNSIDYDHADWAGAALIGQPAKPSMPIALNAGAISSSQITMTWRNTPSGQTSNKIMRSTGGGSYTQVGTASASDTTFTDSGLKASTQYTYEVVASNSAGDSNPSNSSSATTFSATAAPVYLSDLTYTSGTTGYGTIQMDKTVNGNTITLRGVTYAKGIGTHAPSTITYNLAGGYTNFLSDVGVDDEANGNGSVIFQVYADGVKVYDSGTVTGASPAQSLNLNVTGVQQLQLVVVNGIPNNIDYDHSDWAGARLIPAS